MPLFWIVSIIDDKPFVFLQEGAGGDIARLKASTAGFAGPYSEMHELDAKTAKAIPKKMIGRLLDQSQANALLKKIGRP